MSWWCRAARLERGFGTGLALSLGVFAGCGGQSERQTDDGDAGAGGAAGTGGTSGGTAGVNVTGGVAGVAGTSGDPGCYYGGVTYEPGESFPADDGCNTCFCNADGGVSCTLIGCPEECFYEGQTYANGSIFPASDGCNTCQCSEGVVGCTEIGCPRSCTYEGVIYDDGATFPAPNGCGTCTCSGGEVTCMLAPCPPTRCDMLSFWYTERVQFGAKICNPNIDTPQCQSLVVSMLPCGCPTFVNEAASLESWLAEWTRLGCANFRPPCIPCPPPPSSAICTAGGTCMDLP